MSLAFLHYFNRTLGYCGKADSLLVPSREVPGTKSSWLTKSSYLEHLLPTVYFLLDTCQIYLNPYL